MNDVISKEEKACWKTIGVWGREEPRCPKLKEVIHCRNCDVFTQAGRNLLERDLPEDYKGEWSKVLEEKKEEERLGTLSVVIFRIQGEWLALPAGIFAEVIDVGIIHTVPHRQKMALLGVINVNGEIQLCVSLERYLGISPDRASKDNDEKSYGRMLVVNKDGEQWAFPVDEIHGIHFVYPDLFQNIPVTVAKAKTHFTKGIFMWEDKYVAILDDDLLIYSLTRRLQ